jgi:hypothetical protein
VPNIISVTAIAFPASLTVTTALVSALVRSPLTRCEPRSTPATLLNTLTLSSVQVVGSSVALLSPLRTTSAMLAMRNSLAS